MLASCVPLAKAPLSDALASEPDKDLIGTWIRTNGGETFLMMIGRHALADANKALPRGLMSYERFRLGKDGTLSRESVLGVFFVSRIKGESYANVFDDNVVQEAQKQGAWGYSANSVFLLVKYRLTKNTLAISFPDVDKVKAAIAKGALKGTVTKSMGSDQVEITGGADAAGYLAREGSSSLYSAKPEETWLRAKIVPVE
jgi:hypothetical protein